MAVASVESWVLIWSLVPPLVAQLVAAVTAGQARAATTTTRLIL